MFLFIGQKNFQKKFGRDFIKKILKKIRRMVGVWRWVCGGGWGSLDGKTEAQGGRFDRCNVA